MPAAFSVFQVPPISIVQQRMVLLVASMAGWAFRQNV